MAGKTTFREKASSVLLINAICFEEYWRMSALAADCGATWSYDEVKALISIWADEKVQHQLDNCTKKVPVFQNIAKRLEEAGFTRSFIQIREKLKKLKQQYKKVKDNNQCIMKTGPYFITIRAPSRMKKGLQAVYQTLHQEVKNQLTALTILHCKCIDYYESSWQSFQPE